jgi:hypothetical protein
MNQDNKEKDLIIQEFKKRRDIFNEYIEKNKLRLAICPSCGYPTLLIRDGDEICEICRWEDDGQDDKNADEILGGPNKNLSLTTSRLIIGKKLLDLSEKLSGTLNLDQDYVFNYLSKSHKNQQEEEFLGGLITKVD